MADEPNGSPVGSFTAGKKTNRKSRSPKTREISPLNETEKSKPKKVYSCVHCGQPKKGHICTAQNKDNRTMPSITSPKRTRQRSPKSPALQVSPKSPTSPAGPKSPRRSLSPLATHSISNSPLATNPLLEASPSENRTRPMSTESFINLTFADTGSSLGFEKSIEIIPNRQVIDLDNDTSGSALGAVSFTTRWFDMAISALDTLQEKLNSFPLTWQYLDTVVIHLSEEKQYLQTMKEEYQIESLQTPEQVSLLGKRSVSIIRDVENGLLTNIDPSYLEDEPARKLAKNI